MLLALALAAVLLGVSASCSDLTTKRTLHITVVAVVIFGIAAQTAIIADG